MDVFRSASGGNPCQLEPAITPEERLEQLTESSELKRLYDEQVRKTRGKGTDRVDHQSFRQRFDLNASDVSRKTRDGSYTFAPYAEILRNKGRNRSPRVISIPTIRDRLMLSVLKEIIHQWFDDCVPKALPNTHIRKVSEALVLSSDPGDLALLKADIANFYGSIDHRLLRGQLQKRLGDGIVTKLIMRAITTPTVPPGSRAASAPRTRSREGVPQGLSISNILASIYAQPLDRVLESLRPKFSSRYVDDILVAFQQDRTEDFEQTFRDALSALGLTENKAKRLLQPADEPFDYLGYRFDWPTISVRPASVDRFLASIAARLTSFREGEKRFLADHPWIDSDVYREVLVEDLNERITGATAAERRYGWLFYFLEMNDLDLLHTMDNAISNMTHRLPAHHAGKLPGLKSLSTAYFEARHRPRGPYIMQYDSISTTPQKIAFLSRRGHFPPGSRDPQEVDTLFDKIQRRRLARLDADVAFLS